MNNNMKKSALALLLVSSLALTACNTPTLDGTNESALKASVSKVREALPEHMRSEFDESMQLLVFSSMDIGNVFAAAFSGGDIEKIAADGLQKSLESVDGLTGEEVISKAQKIIKERQAEERRQALNEIKELEAKKAETEKAQKKLNDFIVEKSRFYLRDSSYRKTPIIELAVKNNTEYAVSRAYFKGVVASPGRSVPWIKESFNYPISGGIEPQESAEWSLAPNMFSAWGKTDVPEDAVLTVTVYRLDGADGKQLFTDSEFTERDAKRLEALKDKFN